MYRSLLDTGVKNRFLVGADGTLRMRELPDTDHWQLFFLAQRLCMTPGQPERWQISTLTGRKWRGLPSFIASLSADWLTYSTQPRICIAGNPRHFDFGVTSGSVFVTIQASTCHLTVRAGMPVTVCMGATTGPGRRISQTAVNSHRYLQITS